MSQAFASCGRLTSLDISEWDVQSATSMASMFSACDDLVELNLSSWTTANVTNMFKMFDSCKKLTSLDLSGWDTGNVTSMKQMFGSCWNLLSLKLPENVSKVTTMELMFYQCRALTELDLSAWNTASVENMSGMFNMGEVKGALAKIYVGDGWNVEKVTSSGDMFKNCKNLEGGNGTKFSESNPTDNTNAHAGEGGYLTKK
jgi:surface protein